MRNLGCSSFVSRSDFAQQANFSTGILETGVQGGIEPAARGAEKWSEPREVSVLSGLWHVCSSVRFALATGERKESTWTRESGLQIPNRKDRQKADLLPLFLAPNTPRMGRFAEGVYQRSDAPDGQVMDRDTECVAGGFDAV